MSLSTPLEPFVLPPFPTIRQIPNASWPTVEGTLPKPTVKRPVLNKVYFSCKALKQTHKTFDPNGQRDIVRKIWEIPFSVDVNEPVTELTQKIQAVMTAKKIYKHWDINFSNFTILASEELTLMETLL